LGSGEEAREMRDNQGTGQFTESRQPASHFTGVYGNFKRDSCMRCIGRNLLELRDRRSTRHTEPPQRIVAPATNAARLLISPLGQVSAGRNDHS
jgi:hypothetical protein